MYGPYSLKLIYGTKLIIFPQYHELPIVNLLFQQINSPMCFFPAKKITHTLRN